MNAEWKSKVASKFDRSAASYGRYSVIQKTIASTLIKKLPDRPFSSILEIGCGDGALTSLLTARFPQSLITATDISPAMIAQAKQAVTGSAIDWRVMDGETIIIDKTYDLIISSMTVQWFNDLPAALGNWRKHISADGIIAFSRPGKYAFKEWAETLRARDLESGLLPVQETGDPTQEETHIIQYPSTMEFLHELNYAGVSTPRSGYVPLGAGKLRQLCRACDDTHGGKITWHILYEIYSAL